MFYNTRRLEATPSILKCPDYSEATLERELILESMSGLEAPFSGTTSMPAVERTAILECTILECTLY